MRRTSITIALLLFACSDPANLEPSDDGGTGGGNTSGTGGSSGSSSSGTGGSSGTSGGVPGDGWPVPDACVAASNSELIGVWEGAIEDFSFEPVIPLRLELRGASEDGGVCGTVLWGDGEPPPPVSDPNLGYPVDTGFGKGGPSYVGFYSGATYTMLDGGVRGTNVRFVLSGAELWREWCSLQTPFGSSEFGYGCLPPNNTGMYDYPSNLCHITDDDTGMTYDFSIDKCTLCMAGVCACDETGCRADASTPPRAAFDLVLGGGGEAVGTVDGLIDYRDVELTRVE